MFARKVRFVFIIITLIFITVSLGLAGTMNVASFKTAYTKSILSSYTVAGAETVKKIEYAVRYGKPLTNYLGMEQILKEVKRTSPDIESVFIVLPDGTITYNDTGADKVKALPGDLSQQVDFKYEDSSKSYSVILFDQQYHVLLPIFDRQNIWIGSLDITFNEAVVDSRSSRYQQDVLVFLLFLTVISVAFLAIILYKIPVLDELGKIQRKSILVIILGIFSLAQIVYGSINFTKFEKVYLDTAMENTNLTAKIIHKDIQSVIDKGIYYSELNQTKEWMDKIVQYVPEIEKVYLFTSKDSVNYQTNDLTYLHSEINPDYIYNLALGKDLNGEAGRVTVVVSEKYIKTILRDMALDSVTVFIISLILMVELLRFLTFLLERGSNTVRFLRSKEGQVDVRGAFSFLGFLFFTCSSITVTFLPLAAKELYHPIAGLPVNAAAGLPISAEMLSSVIALLLARQVINKKGWLPAFISGLVIFGIGLLLSGTSGSFATFIIARIFTGMGLGFSALALFPAIFPVSIYSLYTGICCGSALGAMLANIIGFSGVFFTSFALIAVLTLFTLFLYKKNIIAAHQQVFPDKTITVYALGKQFGGSIMAFSFYLVIPLAIHGMFLNYFFPLYAESNGMSLANTGRVFLLFGLILLVFKPLLDRRANTKNARKYAIWASFILTCAMIVFTVKGTIGAVLITVILLGIGNSIWHALLTGCTTALSMKSLEKPGEPAANNTEELAEEFADTVRNVPAVDIISIFWAIGSAIGPVLFGLVSIIGIFKGVGIISIGSLVAIVLFALYTIPPPEPDVTQANI
jgi:MFS family permease